MLSAIALAGCGGGGGSTPSSTPPAAAVSVAPAPTVSLALSSNAVGTGGNTKLTWTTTNATACTASGSWSGTQTTSGTLQLATATIGTFPYTLSCTGAGGTGSASTSLSVSPASQNSMPIVFDGGPTTTSNSLDVPYVSVKVCTPGTTTCQIIDHILLDTGSNGLRLVTGVLNAGVALPAVKDVAGRSLATCAQFASGTIWGALRRADVSMGGESAQAISIEIGGDADPIYNPVPAACNAKGQSLGTVAQLGANGILGVGLFAQDCGQACTVSVAPGAYYACSNGISGSACVGTMVGLNDQLNNPVSRLAVDNNGVILRLPAVAAGGTTSLSGALIFGIGTQANNQFANESVFGTSDIGQFTTIYKGTTATTSFIDSGSNALVFNDSALTQCTSPAGYYCPAATTGLTVQTVSANGSVSSAINLSIDPANRVYVGTVAQSIGGAAPTSSGISGFDLGLPFFFGRGVFVGIEGKTTPRGTGPFWAY